MYITLYATWGNLLAFDFTAVLVMNDSDSGRIEAKLECVNHIAFIYEHQKNDWNVYLENAVND